MRQRPVRPNRYGLVTTPPPLDCRGEKCPVAETRGACFTDWHHIYFPFNRFKARSELAFRFYSDPSNLISMPRCRHQRIHERNSFTIVPPDDVMISFLDESEQLRDLGVKVRNMSEIVTALTSTDVRQQVFEEKKRESSLEWLQLHDTACEEISAEVLQFELLPAGMVEAVLRRRTSVQQRAADAGFGSFVLLEAA